MNITNKDLTNIVSLTTLKKPTHSSSNLIQVLPLSEKPTKPNLTNLVSLLTNDLHNDTNNNNGTHNDDILSAKEEGGTVRGRKGNDTITGGAGDDKLYGGRGNDTITGGAGNDKLYGGRGNDTISTGSGSNTVYAGQGKDVIIIDSESKENKVNGGQNSDKIVFEHDISAYNIVNLGKDGINIRHNETGNITVAKNIESFSFNGQVVKTDALPFADVVRPTIPNDDILLSKEEGGTVRGRKGNDTITGGAGDDKLYGGRGNDTITGGAGNDKLYGGRGNDTISTGSGSNTVYAGQGKDVIIIDSESKENKVNGGQNSDKIVFEHDISAYNIVNLGKDGINIRHNETGNITVAKNIESFSFNGQVVKTDALPFADVVRPIIPTSTTPSAENKAIISSVVSDIFQSKMPHLIIQDASIMTSFAQLPESELQTFKEALVERLDPNKDLESAIQLGDALLDLATTETDILHNIGNPFLMLSYLKTHDFSSVRDNIVNNYNIQPSIEGPVPTPAI